MPTQVPTRTDFVTSQKLSREKHPRPHGRLPEVFPVVHRHLPYSIPPLLLHLLGLLSYRFFSTVTWYHILFSNLIDSDGKSVAFYKLGALRARSLVWAWTLHSFYILFEVFHTAKVLALPSWQSGSQGIWRPNDYLRGTLFILCPPGIVYMMHQRRRALAKDQHIDSILSEPLISLGSTLVS
ncbi:hypothetical protein GALMADRAFT_249485 [Galerina marginata CBS 339.88]|uniref:Uncharacterized protein n=1 Tax=Galerina marginata (strain CBS 339.88) TaxID=685588 RepID=A0A067T6B1_GALM3|nr:hypothetical protein GALMADRAFT_249485 [Galerina marginata CBS 339.88]